MKEWDRNRSYGIEMDRETLFFRHQGTSVKSLTYIEKKSTYFRFKKKFLDEFLSEVKRIALNDYFNIRTKPPLDESQSIPFLDR